MERIILIADDHFIVRQGVEMMLKRISNVFQILHAEDYQEALLQIGIQNINVLIFDIEITGFNGIKQIQELKEANNNLKILIFSGYNEDMYALNYLQAGADGYLNKNCSAKDFEYAIDAIINRGKFISPRTQELLLDFLTHNKKHVDNPLKNLSKRELEVCKLLLDGKGNLEIANTLSIHSNTISTYKNRLFYKLKIKSIIELSQVYNQYS